jgi:hypothetical protein
MIISGIAATAHADLQGHVLLAGAVDLTRRVPLYCEHKRAIGEVTSMMYVHTDLYIVAETDDAEALKLGYFSVAGKPRAREQRGDVWHVSRFDLDEISLVKSPANSRCVVIERKEHYDPFRAVARTRMRELDLYSQAISRLSEGLNALGRL